MNSFATFRNDPFFSGLDLPFEGLALENRSRYDNSNRQISQRQPTNDQSLSPFDNPLGLMQSMMGSMGQMFRQLEPVMSQNFNGQNGQGLSFSSATVMSMDRRSGDQPRIIQATSEQLRGPEGLARTRKAVRDTGRNLEKMEVAHRLGERGHRITKERDPVSGRILEHRDFEHIDDENEFERQWFSRAEQYGFKNSNRNGFGGYTDNLLMTPPTHGRLRSQSQEPRQLAIEHTQSDKNEKQRRRK
ncbi:unnamed protein product [Adineta ricciae]|uniref:Myeloid leukemia factor n=1 Tax=Adineta ricciae TaxID=249248 RepID=A0A813U2C1_ADIRI|nr:unnamed protein product [Adineta ricciae]CAF0839351.1 unnamed protein product [Adineta ricciae]